MLLSDDKTLTQCSPLIQSGTFRPDWPHHAAQQGAPILTSSGDKAGTMLSSQSGNAALAMMRLEFLFATRTGPLMCGDHQVHPVIPSWWFTRDLRS